MSLFNVISEQWKLYSTHSTWMRLSSLVVWSSYPVIQIVILSLNSENPRSVWFILSIKDTVGIREVIGDKKKVFDKLFTVLNVSAFLSEKEKYPSKCQI